MPQPVPPLLYPVPVATTQSNTAKITSSAGSAQDDPPASMDVLGIVGHALHTSQLPTADGDLRVCDGMVARLGVSALASLAIRTAWCADTRWEIGSTHSAPIDGANDPMRLRRRPTAPAPALQPSESKVFAIAAAAAVQRARPPGVAAKHRKVSLAVWRRAANALYAAGRTTLG